MYKITVYTQWRDCTGVWCTKLARMFPQELPGGYGRMKPDIVTYGTSVRGSAIKLVEAHIC